MIFSILVILIFDLMNTLLDDPFFCNFYNKLTETQKKNWSINTNHEAYILFEEGKILESEYFNTTYKENPKKYGLVSPQRMKKLMLKEIYFLPGIPELISKIKKKNFILILASNYSIWYQEIFEKRKELNDWFDLIFFSCEMGIRKPKKEFFLIIQSCIETYYPNKSILYFDDHYQNIQAIYENKLNWECVWIKDKDSSAYIIEKEIIKKCPQFECGQ